jgi:hypothetical protein
MKTKLIAATAMVAAFALTGAANAAVTVDTKVANQLNVTEGVLLDDFNVGGTVAAHVSFVGNTFTGPQNPVSTAAEPPFTGPGDTTICCDSNNNPYNADATGFESVEGGGTSTFTATDGYYLSSFSFYMGSPDQYNHIVFNLVGGGTTPLDGDQIWGGSPNGNGDRSLGFRVYYNFNGLKVSSITFTSDQNAFEGDNFAGTLGIPEPATWAMMIMGFGMAGGMMRAKRRLALAA